MSGLNADDRNTAIDLCLEIGHQYRERKYMGRKRSTFYSFRLQKFDGARFGIHLRRINQYNVGSIIFGIAQEFLNFTGDIFRSGTADKCFKA